jgi:hypothetical protein
MLEWMLDCFGAAVLLGQAVLFLALGDIEAPCPRSDWPGLATADPARRNRSKSAPGTDRS